MTLSIQTSYRSNQTAPKFGNTGNKNEKRPNKTSLKPYELYPETIRSGKSREQLDLIFAFTGPLALCLAYIPFVRRRPLIQDLVELACLRFNASQKQK